MPFTIKRSSDNSFSCDLFNIFLEKILHDAAFNRTETIYTRNHMLLANADDMDIMGRSLREVTAVFKRVLRKMFWQLIKRKSPRLGQSVNAGDCNFDVLSETNNISLEIKR